MFAIWLLPDTNDTKYLSRIITNLSRKFNSPEFLPHMTIYGLVDARLSVVEDAITNAISNLNSFTVKKSEINYSDNIWKTIFINIVLNQELESINEKLAQKLGQYVNYEFLPHISLIYKKIAESKKVKIIDGLDIKNEFVVDKVAIQQYSENVNEWKIIRYFKLNRTVNSKNS